MAGKLAEAEQHMRNGEKYLKVTLFRWTPDFQSAADEFSQAAQCYRIAGDLCGAKIANLRASDNYRKCNAFFHAAKAVENTIVLSKMQNNAVEMYDMALQSSSLYRQHGSGDAAASLLVKVGTMLEESAPEKAIKLYQKAALVSANESTDHQGAEYCAKATKLLIRHGCYELAIESIKQEMAYHKESDNRGAIGRLCVGMVLVELAKGDTVAADKAYKEWASYCEHSEMITIQSLITAFDEQDRDEARKALSAPFIRHMDIEFSRLATTIALPVSMEVQSNQASVGRAVTFGDVQEFQEDGAVQPGTAQQDGGDSGLC